MLRRLFLVCACAVVAGVALTAWGWNRWTGDGPAGPDGVARTLVRIPSGMTLSAAADTLQARGLLSDRRVLVLGARLTGRGRDLRAGLYELKYGTSARGLLADLTTGLSVQVAVTIPEGLDADEIATAVAGRFPFAAVRFAAVADSLARRFLADGSLLDEGTYATLDSVLATTPPPGARRVRWSEGLLAPDTYHFGEGADASEVAAVLLKTQLERLDRATRLAVGGPNGELSPYGLLTLASVVEAEARRDDERTRVAAVYTNRLERGWRLEADPTVAFILDKKGDRLYFKHLKVDSPWNSYRNRGLPPGPIGAPGEASLAAAARPDPACDAMYFVSDGAGGHVFSRTAQEHEEAVRRFRALRARGAGGD